MSGGTADPLRSGRAPWLPSKASARTVADTLLRLCALAKSAPSTFAARFAKLGQKLKGSFQRVPNPPEFAQRLTYSNGAVQIRVGLEIAEVFSRG